MKMCKKCGSYFEKRCRTCANIYALQYRKSHQEILKTANLKWRLENPEKQKQRIKQWRKKNKAKIQSYRATRYIEHRNTEIKSSAQWAKNNPNKRRIYEHNRRAKTVGVLSNDLSDKLFVLQKGRCSCCGKPLGDNYHLDHKMPLALGGLNIDNNIQLLRDKCNMQKHTKHPNDFMRERGFLL